MSVKNLLLGYYMYVIQKDTLIIIQFFIVISN